MFVRNAVRGLAQLPPQHRVCVAGRVVACTAAPGPTFILQDDTGCVTVPAESIAPPLGAFVRVVAHTDAVGLARVELVEVLTAGGDRFARGDSDWTFLTGSRLENLRRRAELKRAIRRYFDTEGLLEVDTPAIVPCPGLDVHLDAIETLGGPCEPGWLHTSPEYQMKRLLTTGLPGIYQLGKAFRRGERGRQHEPEFLLLEWYRTFADAEDLMRDTERLVATVALELTGTHTIPGRQGPVDVTPPWPRLTVEEAFRRHAGVELADAVQDEGLYYQLLAERIEPELGRGRAMFLTDYPAPMASLARISARDPRYAERFEAYLDGVELCNGFSELIDSREQRERLERDQHERRKLDRSVYPVDERFIAALEEGIPPSGGNALGVDRLLMLLLGASHIDQVIALPSSRMQQ